MADQPSDRSDAADEGDYHGDSTPDSDTAPPSGGEAFGSDGSVTRPGRGPDLRPRDTSGVGRKPEPGETAVPQPEKAGVPEGGTGSGSAAAAAADAGSAPPADEEPGEEEEDR